MKENSTLALSTAARTPPRRKFGTVLSANSPTAPPSRHKKAGLSKTVAAVTTTLPDNLHTETDEQTYSVCFGPGSMGMQLEQIDHQDDATDKTTVPALSDQQHYHYHCRVQRLVDPDGLPGQARASGKIQPGHVLVAVNHVPITSYSHAIRMIRASTTEDQRHVLFASLSNNNNNSDQASVQSTSTNTSRHTTGTSTTNKKSSKHSRARQSSSLVKKSVPGSLRMARRRVTTTPDDQKHRHKIAVPGSSSLLQTTRDWMGDTSDDDEEDVLLEPDKENETVPANTPQPVRSSRRSWWAGQASALKPKDLTMVLTPDARHDKNNDNVNGNKKTHELLHKQVQELQDTVQAQKSTIQSLMMDREHTLVAQSQKSDEKLKALQLEMEQQHAETQGVVNEKKQLEEKIRQVEHKRTKESESSNKRVQELQELLQDKAKLLEQQEIELQALRKDATSLANTLGHDKEQLERQLSLQAQELQMARDESAKLENSLQLEKAQVAQLLKTQNDELIQARKDAKSAYDALQTQKDAFRQERELDGSTAAFLEDELQLAKETIKDLKTRFASQKNGHADYQQEIAKLQSHVSQLEQEKVRLSQEWQEERARLLTGQDQRRNTNADAEKLKAKQDELDTLTKLVKALQYEKKHVLEQSQEWKQAAQDSKEEEAYLRSQLEAIKMERFASQATLDSSRNDLLLQEKETELENIRSLYDTVRSDRNRLENELHEAKQSLQALKKAAEERELQRDSKLEEQINSKFHEASVISKAMLAESRCEISELHRQVRGLEASKVTLKREVESLERINKDWSAKVSSLEEALDEKDDRLSQAMLQSISKDNLLEENKAELSRKTSELGSCKRSLQDVQEKYEHLKERVSQMSDASVGEKAVLVEELEKVREELADSNARCNDLESLVRSLRRNTSDAETRLTRAREQLDRERGSARNASASAQKAIKTLTKELQEAKQQSVDTKRRAEALSTERNSLKSSLKSMKDQQMSLEATINDMETKLNETTNELNVQQEKLTSLVTLQKNKTETFSRLLQESEVRCQRLRNEIDASRKGFEDQMERRNQEMEAKIRKKDDVIKHQQEEISSLFEAKSELLNARAELERLTESQRRSDNKANTLKEQIDQLRKDYAVKVDSSAQLHLREVQRLSDDKQDLVISLRKCQDKLEATESKLCSAEEGLVASRRERERFIAEKHETLLSLQKAQDTISALQSEINFLRDNSICSSEDSSDELKGLSRSDLKSKCSSLRSELQRAKTMVSDKQAKNKQRDVQMQRLEEDLQLMAVEIEHLVGANEMFETHVKKVRLSKEEAERAAVDSQSRLTIEKERARSIEQKLTDQESRNQALAEKLKAMEERATESSVDNQKRCEELVIEVAKLQEQLCDATERTSRLSEELKRSEVSIQNATERADLADKKVLLLQEELREVTELQEHGLRQYSALQSETNDTVENYKCQINDLEQECSNFRVRVAELDFELEARATKIANLNQVESNLQEELGKQRQETIKSEKLREELVTKLSKASDVAISQKESIDTLERRSQDAERTIESLSSQISQLQECIEKMERSAETSGDLQLLKMQELSETCASLDKERTKLRDEALQLREELRKSRQLYIELENSKTTIEKRVGTTKTLLETKTSELVEAQTTLEEVTSKFSKLEIEAESCRMENEHLKAKLQLTNGTVARLKSDVLLCREAALQAEFKLAETQKKDTEISDLEVELRGKDSKLATLSEVYRSQQQVMLLSQKLEEELLQFVDELLGSFKTMCRDISSHLQSNTSGEQSDQEAMDLEGAADLAGSSSISSQRQIENIVKMVAETLIDKQKQLSLWKSRRSARVNPQVSTPESKSSRRSIPDTPTIMNALHNVKKVLNEQVLTPVKQKQSQPDKNLDVEYFQKVVYSLEVQIDNLLEDLKSANEALQAKDQMFADLEHLVAHHESERDRLQKDLDIRMAQLQKLERRCNEEATRKVAAEKEVSSLKEQLDKSKEASFNSDNRERFGENSPDSRTKLVGGRLVINFLNGRSKARVATAMRQWACHTSVSVAIEHQRQTANELAQQLVSTREKLCVLKQHLKQKSSRTQQGNRQSRGPSLGCILEGYETT